MAIDLLPDIPDIQSWEYRYNSSKARGNSYSLVHLIDNDTDYSCKD